MTEQTWKDVPKRCPRCGETKLDEAEGAHERRIVGAIEKVSSQYTISCEPSDAYVLRGLELALEAIDQLPRKEQDDD